MLRDFYFIVLFLGIPFPAGEVRRHLHVQQAHPPAEGVLQQDGGGRRHDAGRPPAPQHDRDQEGAGRRPGGHPPRPRRRLQEDLQLCRLRDAAQGLQESQDCPAQH